MMRKNVHLLVTLVALGLLFGCASVSFGQNGGKIPMVGSREKATDDPEVVEAAEFAVSERKEKEGGPLSLVSIKRARIRSTRDTVYSLCLEVKAGDETDAGADAQDVEVLVSAPPTRGKKSWKLETWEEKDCGGSASHGNHATPGGAPVDPITSVYSSLSNCKLVRNDRESDSSTQACRGVAGYNLRLEYADVRESITVISPDGKQHQLEFWNVISSAFSHVGEKAEWRVVKRKGKVVPVALIIRFTATEGGGDTPKPVSYLAVAKITPQKICVTDKIAPSATANEEARRAADASADKPCIEPPTANHYSRQAASVAGVYENLTVGQGSGDLEGMRVVIVQAGGGHHAIFQQAQGGAEDPQPEFVSVNVKGMSVEFTAGSTKYTGTVTASELKLKNADGDTQTLKRKPCASYFR
jgi:hypothetical protein